MSFIGTQPGYAYSTITKDTFNGNNSDTEFTLSTPASTNGVEVFVENVQQEPTTAYSISGTTLTFTSAPPTGTGNIYVIHRNPTVQTVVPPTGVVLNASAVTATGNISTGGALKVEATSGGIYTITGTDTATNRTLTLPDETGTVLTSASTLSSSKLSGALPALDGSALTGVSAGKVLQVQSVYKSSYFTTTTTLPSFTDITGMSVTITPSSTSSKILVLVTGGAAPSSSNYNVAVNLVRGSTSIFQGDAAGSATRGSGGGTEGSGGNVAICISYLDSPNTTNATTYKLQLGVESGATGGFGGSYLTSGPWATRIPGSIVLMEIA